MQTFCTGINGAFDNLDHYVRFSHLLFEVGLHLSVQNQVQAPELACSQVGLALDGLYT